MFQTRVAEALERADWDLILASLERTHLVGVGVGYTAAGASLELGARVARGEVRDLLTQALRRTIPIRRSEDDLLERVIGAFVDHIIESGALASVILDRAPASAAVSFVALLVHEEMRRRGGYDLLAGWAESRAAKLVVRGRAYRRLAQLRGRRARGAPFRAEPLTVS